MAHTSNRPSARTDLGRASVETRGPSGPRIDYALGQVPTGLSND